MQGSGADGDSYRVLEADFGPGLTGLAASAGLKLLAASPADGCLPFAHTTNYAGAAVLIQRDNCTFQAKVHRSLHPQQQGANLGIISVFLLSVNRGPDRASPQSSQTAQDHLRRSTAMLKPSTTLLKPAACRC